MSLQIVQIFGFASIQAAEHYDHLPFGVPIGGAFDRRSMRRANAIVGNSGCAPCIELALTAMRLRALEPTLIGIAGARCTVKFRDQVAKPGAPLWLQQGDEVDISAPSPGVLTYVAARGGFSKIGLATKRLVAGETLEIQNDLEGDPVVVASPWITSAPIEVEPGPQSSMFNMSAFFAGKYEISRQIDRRGLRIMGLPLTGSKEIASEPCCPGAIQVTPDGQMIIVGPDGPTIGGYPKIAVCIRDSLGIAAQAAPGERIVFTMRR